MNLLSDIITYIRRIIKSPSNASITDLLLIDYINRFYLMDMDARLQMFDLKTKYQFQTVPGVDQYNMPLYNPQTEGVGFSIAPFPVYQGFLDPCYINGVQVHLQTQKNSFFNIYPNIVQNLSSVAIGNGTTGPYTLNIPILPNSTSPQNPPLQGLLRGHVDMAGVIAAAAINSAVIDPIFGTTINTSIPSTSILPAVYITTLDANGNSIVISDTGQFLYEGAQFPNYGLLMVPPTPPLGYANSVLPNGGSLASSYTTTQNTINYFTGVVENLYFPTVIPSGQNIAVQCYYFATGLPRQILYYNNTITLRTPPDRQYLVEMDAYLTPAALLNTVAAIPFGYMAEYIARGAARKILSDTGDAEQLSFYEPMFREQELLVWKRSQRQWTNNRTETIYSRGHGNGIGVGTNSLGGGGF